MLLCYVIDSGLSTSLLLLATLIIMFYIYIYVQNSLSAKAAAVLPLMSDRISSIEMPIAQCLGNWKTDSRSTSTPKLISSIRSPKFGRTRSWVILLTDRTNDGQTQRSRDSASLGRVIIARPVFCGNVRDARNVAQSTEPCWQIFTDAACDDSSWREDDTQC